MSKNVIKIALIALISSTLLACKPTSSELVSSESSITSEIKQNPTAEGWDSEDAQKMFDKLGAYLPFPGPGMKRYDFQAEAKRQVYTAGETFYEDIILITFEMKNALAWLENYEATLFSSNYEIYSLDNGAPKNFYNIYHNYNYGTKVVELVIGYTRDDEDLESIELNAITYSYGRVENGIKDAKMTQFANKIGDHPFFEDGLFLFYDELYITKEFATWPAFLFRWTHPKKTTYNYDELLIDADYQLLDDWYSTYSFVGAESTLQLNFITGNIMQPDGLTEYTIVNVIIYQFSGFPYYLFDQGLNHSIPGLKDVSAQMLELHRVWPDELYLYFQTLDVTGFKNLLVNDGWVFDSYGEKAYTNIDGIDHTILVYKQSETKLYHVSLYLNQRAFEDN